MPDHKIFPTLKGEVGTGGEVGHQITPTTTFLGVVGVVGMRFRETPTLSRQPCETPRIGDDFGSENNFLSEISRRGFTGINSMPEIRRREINFSSEIPRDGNSAGKIIRRVFHGLAFAALALPR